MLEGILLALAFGTVWFYMMCFIVFIAIMALSENDHEFFSLAVLAVFIYVMEASGAFNLFTEPWVLAKWIGVYIIAGVAWSFVKWFSFLSKKADEYRTTRYDWLKDYKRNYDKYNNGQPDLDDRSYPSEKLAFTDDPVIDIGELTDKTKVPDVLKKHFDYYLSRTSYFYGRRQDAEDGIIPVARNFKSKISNWIVWWPTSLIWTLLSDPLMRVANWIFDRLKGTYQLIANKVFAEFE